MKNPFRRNKSKKEPSLASAMSKLADRLEKFQDPVVWQKVLSDAIQTMPLLATQLPTLAVPVSRIEEITVRLSEEERGKLANQVYEEVKPQLQEFSKFVQQSLQEMPAHRLKQLAEKIERGEKPRIQRKRGCVSIIAGDTEVYLGL